MILQVIKHRLYDLVLTFRYTRENVKHYHHGSPKSRWRIFTDLIGWQLREPEFNKMYYAYGLNIAGSRQSDYIGRKEFLAIKDSVETHLKKESGFPGFNYDVVTKDKFYANSILTANGIPCIPNEALITGSKIIFNDKSPRDIDAILEMHGTFFIKNNILEAGDGVLVCRIDGDTIIVNDKPFTMADFREKLRGKVWVVQRQFRSHPGIGKVNATALNTTRIVTIMNGSASEYLTGFQAFATGGAKTDSWSGNSVYVGIDVKNGCLKGSGYFNLDSPDKSVMKEHPDSGITFKDYPVPYLKEAVSLCQKAHHLFYYNFILGWDVAITEEGPVIVEVNEKPGINAVQCIDGGLRSAVRKYAAPYLKNQ